MKYIVKTTALIIAIYLLRVLMWDIEAIYAGQITITEIADSACDLANILTIIIFLGVLVWLAETANLIEDKWKQRKAQGEGKNE